MGWGTIMTAGAVGLSLVAPGASAGDARFPAATVESQAATRVVGWGAKPTALTLGDMFRDQIRLAPRARRAFQVKWRRDGGAWRVRQSGRSTRTGVIRVKYRPAATGRYVVKLVVGRSGPAARVATPGRRVLVVPRRVATPPVVAATPTPSPTPTPTPTATPTPTPSPSPSPLPTFIPTAPQTLNPVVAPGDVFRAYAVGDIGYCGGPTEATAALIPAAATLLLPGDIAYPDGTAANFADCYLPYYGDLLDTTVPVPGNHEYRDPLLAYFDVFGSDVGTRDLPWYQVNQGDWSFYQLNSNCDSVGGCGLASRQYAWLAAQLSVDPNRCIAASWHHPRWSGSAHGPYDRTDDLYRLLAANGADLLLAGHEHSYQRFDRLNADGVVDPLGIREIIVGTGGAPLANIRTGVTPAPTHWSGSNHGVMKLDFGPDSFAWEFLAVDGSPVDSGSDTCGPA